MFCVIFNDTGKTSRPGFAPWGNIVRGYYATLDEAKKFFRERNPHLFDRKWAQAHGYANAGTFDEIVEIDDDGEFIRYCQ